MDCFFIESACYLLNVASLIASVKEIVYLYWFEEASERKDTVKIGMV